MKKILLLLTMCFAFANAQFFYDRHGESRGAYKDSMDYATLVELAQRFRGPILVKKPVEGVKPRKNLKKIPQGKIQRTFEVRRDSLRKEVWLEVEKNEIVQLCVDGFVIAWETSLSSQILNDSCLVFQVPTLIGVVSINVYLSNSNSAHKINLAVGMKYLNFKNEEIVLGYNKYDEKRFKPEDQCVTEWGTIDCSPENSYPETLVSVTGDYLVDKYPVTNCDFTQIMWDSIPQKAIFENESIKSIQEDWISRKRAYKRNGICDAYDSAASMVTLYQAIKYANARSIREGLRPYYILTPSDADNEEILSNGYIIDNLDFTEHENENVEVTEDSTSDGYKLPNLDEWMIFARGGDKKKKAPWGDSSVTFEDVSKYAKFNTKIPQNEKEWTYSGIVGQLLPNGYGLYDIFGLVEEKVLLKRPLYGNLGNPSCLKGGYRVSTTKEGFFETSYPYWKWINYGYFQFGAPGIFSGFRLIRDIGNDAKWSDVKSEKE